MLARLRHAAGHRFQFFPVPSWDESVQGVLRQPAEIGVVALGLAPVGVPDDLPEFGRVKVRLLQV